MTTCKDGARCRGGCQRFHPSTRCVDYACCTRLATSGIPAAWSGVPRVDRPRCRWALWSPVCRRFAPSRPVSDRGHGSGVQPSINLDPDPPFSYSSKPRIGWASVHRRKTFECLPPRRGCGGGSPRRGIAKEFKNLRIDGGSKPFQNRHCGIFQTALKPADVGAVDFGIHRKRFLRQTASNPQASKISRYQRTGLHARRPTPRGLLNHGV